MRGFSWVMVLGVEMEKKKEEEEKSGIWKEMDSGGMNVK